MADMYIRRGSAPSPGVPWPFWAGLAVVVLLAGLAIQQLHARARRRAAETAEAAAPDEPVAPVVTAAGAPPARSAAQHTAARTTPASAPKPQASATTAPAPGQDRAARATLEQARASLEQEDPARARTLAFEALQQAQGADTRRAAEDLLGAIHTRLVFNPYPMDEKIEYTVQRGDSLDALARRHGTTVELLRRGNRIQGSLIRLGSRLRILQGTFRIEVSKGTNELVVFLNDRFFKRYPVGTGRFDQTPTGQSRVTDRIAHPTWWRPDGRAIPYGHPDNELGTHWLSLDIPGYGIHGTWQPETIGHRESAGCIRMLNEDVEELFDLIAVGTEVVITE